MKRNLTILFFLGLSVLLAVPASASKAVRLSLEQLTLEADLVAVVKVLQCESAWGPEHRLIHTRCELERLETIAGEGPRRIQITQPGGRVGRWAQKTHGYHRFVPGQRSLVFLRDPLKGARVVGMSQGVFLPEPKHWRQALDGLHFADDPGLALRLDAEKMNERIRSLWMAKDR